MHRFDLFACLTFTVAAGCAAPVDPIETAASSELPCGDETVATAYTPDGSRIAFCVLEGGVEVVSEGRPSGAPSALDGAPRDLGTCALDLYLLVAATDAPVPAALVDSCAARTGRAIELTDREIVDGLVLADPIAPPKDIAYAAGYCGSGGETNFIVDLCADYTCNGSDDDCTHWCASSLKSTSQRTMTAVHGDEGDFASQSIASCFATTRFRAFHREDEGDIWATKFDQGVPAGWTWSMWMSNPSYWQDWDFRFRAEAAVNNASARHRETGKFVDW